MTYCLEQDGLEGQVAVVQPYKGVPVHNAGHNFSLRNMNMRRRKSFSSDNGRRESFGSLSIGCPQLIRASFMTCFCQIAMN